MFTILARDFDFESQKCDSHSQPGVQNLHSAKLAVLSRWEGRLTNSLPMIRASPGNRACVYDHVHVLIFSSPLGASLTWKSLNAAEEGHRTDSRQITMALLWMIYRCLKDRYGCSFLDCLKSSVVKKRSHSIPEHVRTVWFKKHKTLMMLNRSF